MLITVIITVVEHIVHLIHITERRDKVFLVDLKSRVPIYEQLKKKTLELIMYGVLQPGDKMPSVRNLAIDLGINPNTVQKAYQDMEKDGIIYSASGRGSFICEDVKDKTLYTDETIENLSKAIYEVRLYGMKKTEVIEIVEQEYKKGAGYDTSK